MFLGMLKEILRGESDKEKFEDIYHTIMIEDEDQRQITQLLAKIHWFGTLLHNLSQPLKGKSRY